MSGPRNYSAGTIAGLFAWANGTCYFPGCDEPVVRTLEGKVIVVVDKVHIRGALPTSARYDPTMTDAERSAITNLMLMCVGHHKLIDGDRAAYPVALLHEWKAEREAQKGIGSSLQEAGATGENLEELILRVVRELAPARAVTVELEAAVQARESEGFRVPFGILPTIMELNAHLADAPIHAVATVKNVGGLAVEVRSVNLTFWFRVNEQPELVAFALAGANHLPAYNPNLPYRLLDGAALEWFFPKASFDASISRLADGIEGVSIQVHVQLATGEQVESETVPWREIVDVGLLGDRGPA